jgi:prophage antirepressor-like protein
MNSISFHNTHFTIVPHNGQPWLTAAQIGAALDYADEKAVQRIYTRHSDEFTDAMTGVVKLTTPSGKQEVRIFSLRGAHLIAMFSRTALAKEFRRWVLDVLDKEVGTGQHVTLSDDELHSLAWLWRAADNMMDAAKSIYPLLRIAEHKEAARYYSIIHEYTFTLQQAKHILADKTRLVQPSSLGKRDWDRIIPHLLNRH